MSKPALNVAVLGTGNSGQAFAADLTLKGCRVNLAEVPAFEATLHAIEERGGIELSGKASNGFARLNMITTDLARAVRGVDLIIIGGSAFAHEPFCRAVAPHFEDGQYLWFTSNFGALRFRCWKKQLGIEADVTPVESLSLLYATRAVEPGRVVVTGVKNALPTAALPARRTGAFLEKVGGVLPQLEAADSVLVTSLNNLNPVVHPPMVVFNAGRIESSEGSSWNLYTDGATESVARIMLAMDAERMALLDRIGQRGVPIREAFEKLYSAYAIGRPTLTETLRNSPIHGDPSMPAPETVDTRYLTEDLPFGLVPWAALARGWGVPAPTIEAVVHTASVMLGRNCTAEGLSLADLGIDGMGPRELVDLVG